MKPIGRISLKTGKRGEEHHRAADIGIQIAAEYQRKGYGSEAIKWILEWAFKYGGLHRVGIQCCSYNPGARRLYERLGFVFEGANREAFWYNGGWHDWFTLSTLEDEWREKVQHEKTRTKEI
jgi:RimJ/RimL family protein N-acetyltransferase